MNSASACAHPPDSRTTTTVPRPSESSESIMSFRLPTLPPMTSVTSGMPYRALIEWRSFENKASSPPQLCWSGLSTSRKCVWRSSSSANSTLAALERVLPAASLGVLIRRGSSASLGQPCRHSRTFCTAAMPMHGVPPKPPIASPT